MVSVEWTNPVGKYLETYSMSSGTNSGTNNMHIHLISNIQVSPVALQLFDGSQASPSAGPMYGPGAQL